MTAYRRTGRTGGTGGSAPDTDGPAAFATVGQNAYQPDPVGSLSAVIIRDQADLVGVEMVRLFVMGRRTMREWIAFPRPGHAGRAGKAIYSAPPFPSHS